MSVSGGGGNKPPPGSLRPSLPFCEAYNRVVGGNTADLEALVALGIYVQAEYQWAQGLGKRPSRREVDSFHDGLLKDYSIDKIKKEAEREIDDFSRDVIQSHQRKSLNNAIQSAIETVHSSKRAFVKGVAEAFTGALLWTLTLILFSVILRFAGIDLLEVYHNVGETTPVHSSVQEKGDIPDSTHK